MRTTSSTSVRHDAVSEQRVLRAAEAWVSDLRRDRPEVLRVSYFGSYARGDYVPGSDFDVLIEIAHSDQPPGADRIAAYYPSLFPVDVNLFVYTVQDLEKLRSEHDGFLRAIEPELRPLHP